MDAKNMPPLQLPEPRIKWHGVPGAGQGVYSDAEVQQIAHAYARAYAAERTRPLVEALVAMLQGTLRDGSQIRMPSTGAVHSAFSAIAAEQEHAK